MLLSDFELQVQESAKEVNSKTGFALSVLQYLPVDKKVEFIQYVIDNAVDQNGCFSPIRTEVFFGLGLCQFYAGIEYGEEISPTEAYDLLETNGLLDEISFAIPKVEYNFIRELVVDTTADIARYNSSAAGIVQNMAVDAGDLSNQLDTLLAQIKDKEGLETLSVIKDIVGAEPIVVKKS